MLVEILFYVLISVLFSIWIGFFTAKLGHLLDFCFIYQEIFWKFRFARVWKGSSFKVRRVLASNLNSVQDLAILDDQQDTMSRAYSFAATRNNKIILWLCPVCLSTRISIVISFIVGVLLSFNSLWFLLVIPQSIILNYYFVRE